MCGIVGYFDPTGRLDRAALTRMNGEITHRGPDDEGFLVAGPVGLGMRRLSIIDLAGGHQPISNERQTRSIVFNGEIYNYRELRRDLELKGHRFQTHSDTETILRQYEESGIDCLRRFNGMWGFAIWDAEARRLVLARDRMGVKPLYYQWDGTTLLFASEIKSILASGMARREVNEASLSHYLSFRYVPAPQTIWTGINKLPPGHHLTLDVDRGTLEIARWWDIDYTDASPPASAVGDVAHFSSLFLDAVRSRLVADVPVGIFLSGGLDSSCVAAAVDEVHNAPLSTFTVSFREGAEFSELAYSRQVAERYRTDHHETVIGLEEFIAFLPDFVWHTDEPLADPAAVPLHYVARLARSKVKVVLSGEGADEVLAGYTFEQRVRTWERIARFQRLPRWARDTVPRAVLGVLGRERDRRRLALRNLPLSDRNVRTLPYMVSYLSAQEKRALWPQSAALPDSRDVVRGYYERAGTTDPLHQMLYAYCQDWLVEDLLMKADKMTMANSIELRVPFLDFRLVEWLASRPASAKIGRTPDGQLVTKFLLRQFAEPRLPASVLNRPKQGFPVPILQWMNGPLGERARRDILGDDSRIVAWFERDALAGFVARGTMGTNRADANRLWMLLVLETWARRWL